MRTKPSIRFKYFTDDWEQRKLNEYLEVSRAKNKDEVFGKEDVLSVSGDYGIVNQIEFQGRSFAGVSVAPYGVVETGDVVYTKSPLKSNPYGIIKTNKGKPGIVSTLYAVYKPLDNVCPDFVQVYFEQDSRMNNYMHPLVNKGAKNDMKVSDENALKGEVCFPSRAEQIKISEYFAKLDNLITLHQRKCDEIKELKKYMLQKMFPKKGEKKPEIRFSGFTDDWEQRKLEEVVEDYVEKTTVEDQYPVLTSSQQKGIVLQDEYFSGERVSQNGNIGYFVIPRGYFAFRSRSDNDVFVFNRNDAVDIGIISYFYPVFKPKGVDSDFLLRRLNYGLEDQIKINSEGTGQHVLSLKKFKNMIGGFPSYEEQQKIGAYFKQLDNLITLHQRKCDELKEVKKYMLQNMFPKEG